jgi:hypothetical protein
MLLHIRPLLIVLIALHTAACQRSESSAEMTVPGRDLSVKVSVAGSHPFLAEYQRTLIVSRASRELARMSLRPDTGGYALINVYAVGVTELRVATHVGEDHRVSLDDGTISARSRTGSRASVDGDQERFLGAFDFGVEGEWQFLSANIRAERKFNVTPKQQ